MPQSPEQEYTGIPDVRDGLTREERVVLRLLHETQRERGAATCPPPCCGSGLRHFYISPEELSAMLARLGARLRGTSDEGRRPAP